MTTHRPTRRDALRLLGAGAVSVTAVAHAAHKIKPEQIAHDTFFTDPWSFRFFSLADVRLSDGPFLDAQRLDAEYLLKLEPDRMLANFRKNAGLEPRAPVYGGWESVEPWIEIRCHGHTLGHYLGAAACMYQGTGDARFAERVDYIVAELAECQSKTGGWLTAFPDGVAPLTDSLAGRPFAGVPWYTTHKVLAGLRDAYVHRDSKQALAVLVRFADWIDATCKPVSDESMQKMLDREHGGMAEVLVDTFALTGDKRYLDLGYRFVHRRVWEPLARGEDRLAGLHANTQIPKIIGLQRINQFDGPHEYYRAVDFFWRTVVKDHSFATGGHGDVEHFFPKNEFVKHLDSAKTMETCCTHNMLRLTRAKYERDGGAWCFDYFERSLFNGILASQDPETGMNTYFQATRPGYVRLYHTPFDSFWCCTGSGLENHARYAESIYAHDADKLYVNLFMSSTLNWRDRGVTLKQATRFPDSDVTRLEFTAASGKNLTLAIRHPKWCPTMTVTINGRRHSTSRVPEMYHQITRNFRRGDVIEVRIPMSLHLEPLPNTPDFAALLYGPIVLAGRLGTEGLAPGSQLIINERESGNMLQADVKIPRWTKPLDQLVANTTRTSDSELLFVTTGFEGGSKVELIPWFRLTHERYNLYWLRSEA